MKDPETEQEPRKRSSFLAELKHRKVFRVAATYAVVSWLIIQVAAATFSSFGIPPWAFRFVVLMVILGFPVAIILTWAEKALEQTDPSRNFEDYFDSMLKLAVSFAIIGETDRACQLVDQILSSPSGITTGSLLLDFGLQSLQDKPAFQTVIRKHADQLKDPAILEQYFGGN